MKRYSNSMGKHSVSCKVLATQKTSMLPFMSSIVSFYKQKVSVESSQHPRVLTPPRQIFLRIPLTQLCAGSGLLRVTRRNCRTGGSPISCALHGHHQAGAWGRTLRKDPPPCVSVPVFSFPVALGGLLSLQLSHGAAVAPPERDPGPPVKGTAAESNLERMLLDGHSEDRVGESDRRPQGSEEQVCRSGWRRGAELSRSESSL